MATVFTLTTNADGEICTSVHACKGDAYNSLDQYVEEGWDHDVMGADYEDLSREESRAMFFEAHEWHWSIEQKSVELPEEHPDILLTPAMCDIIRTAVGGLLFDTARKILINRGEARIGNAAEAQNVIARIIKEFS